MTSPYRLALLTDPPTWCGMALSGRSLDLLTALAGSRDARMSDGALIEALWPNDLPAQPLRALHVVVSRVRAVVGEGSVERSGDGYRLALPKTDVDVRDLSDRVERARACAVAGQWEQVLDLTDSLPQVPACADADNTLGAGATPVARLREWAARQAEEARRDRGLALEAAGEHERAVALLREASQRDSGDETVLAALMRAESWVRSPAAALEIYEQYRRRLRERGAVPGPAMRAAHETVLATESPVRHGLEPEPEHFLGRETDVTGVLKALSTHRLVTLTGPGGVGKTTLAQVVAARSRRPAVYVVALAEVSPGADLVRVLLDAVGGPGVVSGDPRRDLAAALAQPGTVLVLDNCEHLADEMADLIGLLLGACPDLRVLATSRRPLDLAAEHVHRLEALDTASSTELFRACALAARPGQVIDDDDLGELLARLEGIPLAIELAAARTRSLSVGQIAERLPGRPDLLTAARDVPARQRTLRAVIEWSWNLLDASERRALARLALLADGFTLAAAEALVGAQAADLLDALVSHSLLVVRDNGLPRFHMLVTVRDFALEQLSTSGDETAARAALHRWAVDLCSRIRFPIDAGDFGDARHPEARYHNRLFQQVAHDEAAILQQLDRLLAQADDHGSDHLPADLRDAICLIGAALMRLWSVTWSYERIADYGPRLIGPAVQPAQDLRGNEAGLSLLALCVTLFLGGWRSAILSLFWEGANSGWWPMLWFVAKVWAVMFFMIWTRGTLVRIRYDHFMKLGWKVLIPISLVWFVLVAVVRAFRTFSGASVQALLLPMAVVFCVIMFILFLIPDKEEEEELYEDYEDADEDADDEDVEILDAEDDHVAFLEGFPVPPPPGTSLPPSPRARRAALAAEETDPETGAATAVGLLEDTDVEDDDAAGSADSAASAESPDSAGVVGTAAPAGTDAATALPTFTLDLKADPAGGKDTDTAAEAPQEGKDD